MHDILQDDIQHLSLCLEFCNTMDWHGSAKPIETLKSASDLLRWGQEHGLVRGGGGGNLKRSYEPNPEVTEDVLAKARTLREASYRTFSAISHKKTPSRKDIAALNEIIAEVLSKARLSYPGSGGSGRRRSPIFEWCWARTDGGGAMEVIWAVSKSVADLLTSNRLSFVKECANEEEGCGYLFIDESKNGARRWCSMASCGNRAKARSYYRRHGSRG